MDHSPLPGTDRAPDPPDAEPEVEDESADPVGDGRSDAEAAATQPPVPGRRPPVAPDALDADLPSEDDPDADAEAQEPGRA